MLLRIWDAQPSMCYDEEGMTLESASLFLRPTAIAANSLSLALWEMHRSMARRVLTTSIQRVAVCCLPSCTFIPTV